MPILIFIVLVVLVAQLGFWDTLTAILGAFGVIALLIVLCVALALLTGLWLVRRRRSF